MMHIIAEDRPLPWLWGMLMGGKKIVKDMCVNPEEYLKKARKNL